MKLNYDKILERASELVYLDSRDNGRGWITSGIQSREVKSILQALVEAINKSEDESVFNHFENVEVYHHQKDSLDLDKKAE